MLLLYYALSGSASMHASVLSHYICTYANKRQKYIHLSICISGSNNYFCKEEWLKLPQRKGTCHSFQKPAEAVNGKRRSRKLWTERELCWALYKVQFLGVRGVTKNLISIYRACWFSKGHVTHTLIRTATWVLNKEDIPAHAYTPVYIYIPPATTERFIFRLFLLH